MSAGSDASEGLATQPNLPEPPCLSADKEAA